MVDVFDLAEDEHGRDRLIGRFSVQGIAECTVQCCGRFLCGEVLPFGVGRVNLIIEPFAFCDDTVGLKRFRIGKMVLHPFEHLAAHFDYLQRQ